jgi:hypothetical protein
MFVESIFKMQRLEVSGAVQHIYMTLGGKGLGLANVVFIPAVCY